MSWQTRALRKTVGAMAAVAVAMTLALGFGSTHSPAAHASGNCFPPNCYFCPGVVFLEATGSGEYPTGSPFGVSPELDFVYANLRTTAGSVGAVVLPQVLPYSAPSVSILTAGLSNLDQDPVRAPIEARNALAYSVPQYLAGERDGVNELWSAVELGLSVCSTEKFVLAGYSQGAMVVHDFLNQLAETDNRALQQSIIGAVLLADPERVKHSHVLEFGTAPDSSYGVCDLVNGVFHVVGITSCAPDGHLKDIAEMFRSRTVSVCDFDDLVCDTSNFVPDLITVLIAYGRNAAGSFANGGLVIHGEYKYVSGAANAGQLMGRFVAAKFG